MRSRTQGEHGIENKPCSQADQDQGSGSAIPEWLSRGRSVRSLGLGVVLWRVGMMTGATQGLVGTEMVCVHSR